MDILRNAIYPCMETPIIIGYHLSDIRWYFWYGEYLDVVPTLSNHLTRIDQAIQQYEKAKTVRHAQSVHCILTHKPRVAWVCTVWHDKFDYHVWLHFQIKISKSTRERQHFKYLAKPMVFV